MSADGHHIGSIHELSVADDGKLNGLVIASGHIRKQCSLSPRKTSETLIRRGLSADLCGSV